MSAKEQIAAVAPAVVTQRNCELAAGMSERQFLDFCRAHPELVTSLGKLRAVPVEDLLSHLRTNRAADISSVEDVDDLLAAVGRKRA